MILILYFFRRITDSKPGTVKLFGWFIKYRLLYSILIIILLLTCLGSCMNNDCPAKEKTDLTDFDECYTVLTV